MDVSSTDIGANCFSFFLYSANELHWCLLNSLVKKVTLSQLVGPLMENVATHFPIEEQVTV